MGDFMGGTWRGKVGRKEEEQYFDVFNDVWFGVQTSPGKCGPTVWATNQRRPMQSRLGKRQVVMGNRQGWAIGKHGH